MTWSENIYQAVVSVNEAILRCEAIAETGAAFAAIAAGIMAGYIFMKCIL